MKTLPIALLFLVTFEPLLAAPIPQPSEEIPFRLYRNYMILVEGRIGSLDGLTFLIDTGASTPVLSTLHGQAAGAEETVEEGLCLRPGDRNEKRHRPRPLHRADPAWAGSRSDRRPRFAAAPDRQSHRRYYRDELADPGPASDRLRIPAADASADRFSPDLKPIEYQASLPCDRFH